MLSDSKTFRQTVLGPTYGGPVTKMSLLPSPSAADGAAAAGTDAAPADAAHGHLVYATAERVVGSVKLPLDGNPHKAMGLLAHPGEVRAPAALTAAHLVSRTAPPPSHPFSPSYVRQVSELAVSFDGSHVITAGGADDARLLRAPRRLHEGDEEAARERDAADDEQVEEGGDQGHHAPGVLSSGHGGC